MGHASRLSLTPGQSALSHSPRSISRAAITLCLLLSLPTDQSFAFYFLFFFILFHCSLFFFYPAFSPLLLLLCYSHHYPRTPRHSSSSHPRSTLHSAFLSPPFHPSSVYSLGLLHSLYPPSRCMSANCPLIRRSRSLYVLALCSLLPVLSCAAMPLSKRYIPPNYPACLPNIHVHFS